MESLRDRVITWAHSGGDLAAGVSLFLSFNGNVLYAKNIEAKGKERGVLTLVSELSRKIKMTERELMGIITNSIITNSTNLGELHVEVTGDSPVTLPGVASENLAMTKRVRLRDEFPFLGRADCPEILSVLVNKMLTAHDTYRKNREKLFDIDFNNLDECYTSGRAVLDPYIQNRDIWAELNYYKIHGKLLGGMPEFAEINLLKKFDEMTTVKLSIELRSNVPRRMTYCRNQLDKKNADKGVIRLRMADLEQEKEMIRKVLITRGEIR
jgi:hypothetical protein